LTWRERDPYDRLAVVCRSTAPGEVSVKRLATMSFATFALAGCAGAGHARAGAASSDDAAATPGVVQGLQRESVDQSRRIAELEARLGLLEQEARGWRQTPGRPSQTVRIGTRREAVNAVDENDDEGSPLPARMRVPVVRLHEREAEPVADEPLVLPEPPSGVSPTLAVVPLPGERATKAWSVSAAGSNASARDRYRAALRALRDRRWDEALESFTRFLSAHPEHALAEDAMYWRGEAHYAQRHYREALIDFEAVVLRASRGAKTADALLKLGLCHQRLGDELSAERYFRQLREQYPSSDAARIASRENAS
jgi:tol-pal system protein YbgF